MRCESTNRRTGVVLMFMLFLLLGGFSAVSAEESRADTEDAASEAAQAPSTSPSLEVYGFAMLDIGHDFKQIDPNWFDTMRVTKLPTVEDEFGRDHRAFAGVRQSRLGVRTTTPTSLGE